MKLVSWRLALCPVALPWDFLMVDGGFEQWRGLYVFGVRVAMWRMRDGR